MYNIYRMIEVIMYYYKFFRTKQFKHEEDPTDYILSNIISLFKTRYPDIDIDTLTLDSIDIGIPLTAARYTITKDIDDIIIDEMKQKLYRDIEVCINNGFVIDKNDTIISFNIVPFDGVSITHSYIFQLLDYYFY